MSRDFASVVGPFSVPCVVHLPSPPPPPAPRDWISKVCACGLLGAAGCNKLRAGEESWSREKPGGGLCFFPIETLGTLGGFPWDIWRDRLH